MVAIDIDTFSKERGMEELKEFKKKRKAIY